MHLSGEEPKIRRQRSSGVALHGPGRLICRYMHVRRVRLDWLICHVRLLRHKSRFMSSLSLACLSQSPHDALSQRSATPFLVCCRTRGRDFLCGGGGRGEERERRVHSILALNGDDLFSHRPQYRNYYPLNYPPTPLFSPSRRWCTYDLTP